MEIALTHMFTEDLFHYGELSALMWQIGCEGHYLGFWRYAYNKEKRRLIRD